MCIFIGPQESSRLLAWNKQENQDYSNYRKIPLGSQEIVMKLKNIYKYYLLLIFLNCHDNRNCNASEKRREIQNLNQNQYKKLPCNCPHARHAPPKTIATVTATLCHKQAKTRPAKPIKSRLKLQGRKPKFKLATSKNQVQMQHANDNEIDNDDEEDDDNDAA